MAIIWSATPALQAVTRAKSLCVLVGNRRAIGMAVRNNQVAKRFTALEWRLGAKIRSL